VVCALLSVLLIVAGTAVGALRVIAPLDLLGTSVTGAQFTLVVGGAVLGVGAGFQHWGDDLVGGPGARPGLNILGGLAVAGGVVLVGATDLISGLLGQSDFTGVDLATAGYPSSGVDGLNLVSIVGFLALVGGLVAWQASGILHLTAAKKASSA